MQTIINGGSGLVNLGTDDKSGRQYVKTPEEYPQHHPKFFIFAESGPTTEEVVVGDQRIQLYGEKTFQEKSAYFNHATKFANAVNAEGNAETLVRLKPTDAGPNPSIRLWMDVLQTTVDTYERNSDNSIKTDIQGDPIVDATTPGVKIKFIATFFATKQEAETFGAATIVAGDQTDAQMNVSQRYPLFDIDHSFFGKDGNLAGLRLWAQTEQNNGILPSKMMAREKAYPYGLAVVRKNSDTGNVKPVSTVFGEQSIMVTFKENVVDPVTLKRLYIGERAVADYQNLNDLRYPKVFGEFGRIHVYQQNIETLLTLFHGLETPFIDASYDFGTSVEDKHLFNFITGTTGTGAPYHSFIFSDTGNSVRLSQSTNVFARGGSDGTMTHASHAALVGEYMDRYLDPSDELQDVAYHVESHFYDSGYPLATKKKLFKAIGLRKDTVVVVSPSEFGQPALTASEEYSVAASLRAEAELYPDSEYFGTGPFRALIQGSAGRIRGSQYTERFPVTYEIAIKSARFMGASNGRWKAGNGFAGQPGSIIESMYDLTIPWTPVSIRNRNWDIGLNWLQREDRSTFFLPCTKTVYQDETSILTSYTNACAIAYCHKVLAKIQRQFSGVDNLTMAQFNERVNTAFSAAIKDKFDGRYIIIPKAEFTSMDQIRGFSWTLPVDFFGPNMRTVMTGYITSRRIEDYAA